MIFFPKINEFIKKRNELKDRIEPDNFFKKYFPYILSPLFGGIIITIFTIIISSYIVISDSSYNQFNTKNKAETIALLSSTFFVISIFMSYIYSFLVVYPINYFLYAKTNAIGFYVVNFCIILIVITILISVLNKANYSFYYFPISLFLLYLFNTSNLKFLLSIRNDNSILSADEIKEIESSKNGKVPKKK